MDATPLRMASWMRRLKFRHLEVLLAVARHRSLTATAEALGASQPAVSQWVADIEAMLGVPLFVRGRQLQPTAYLEPVLWHARRMVNDSQRLQAELRAIEAGDAGVVRIGAMQVAGPMLLPQALLRLRSAGAGLRIELVEDIAAGLWPRFARNELDVLVARLDERAYAAGVPCEALYDDPHCVVAGRHHPLLRKRRPTWVDAAAYPWIMPPAGTALRQAIDATFIAERVAPPHSWLESTAMTPNQVLLQQTECLAVMSGTLARHVEATLGLRALPLQLAAETGPVGMVWHDLEPTPVARRVLDALRDAARQIGKTAKSRATRARRRPQAASG